MDYKNIYESTHLKETDTTYDEVKNLVVAGKSDEEIAQLADEDNDPNATTDIGNFIAKAHQELSNNNAPNGAEPNTSATPTQTVEQASTTEQAQPTEQASTTDVGKDANEMANTLSGVKVDDPKIQAKKDEIARKSSDAQNLLNDYVKKFKADQRIINMLNRYTGAEAKQQAKDAKAQAKLGESLEPMQEEKGGFKYHYKNFLKAGNKVRVGLIIGMAILLIAVGAGVGKGIGAIKNAIKLAKNSDKQDTDNSPDLGNNTTAIPAASDVLGNSSKTDNTTDTTAQTTDNTTTQPTTDTTAQQGQDANRQAQATNTQGSFVPGSNPNQLTNEAPTIENSIQAQANAKPGDVIQRKDGSKYKLNQGDIDWAKNQVGSNNPNGGAAVGNSEKVSPAINDDYATAPETNLRKVDPTPQVEPGPAPTVVNPQQPKQPNVQQPGKQPHQITDDEKRVLTGLGQQRAQLQAQLKQKEAEYAKKAQNFHPTGPNNGPDPVLENEINQLRGKIAGIERTQKNIEKGPQYKGKAAQKAMGAR